MVRAIRTPSSSSSTRDFQCCTCIKREGQVQTDVDGLDSDALLDVGRFRAIRVLMCEHVRFTEGVHKGRAPSTRSTYEMEIPVVRQR